MPKTIIETLFEYMKLNGIPCINNGEHTELSTTTTQQEPAWTDIYQISHSYGHLDRGLWHLKAYIRTATNRITLREHPPGHITISARNIQDGVLSCDGHTYTTTIYNLADPNSLPNIIDTINNIQQQIQTIRACGCDQERKWDTEQSTKPSFYF